MKTIPRNWLVAEYYLNGDAIDSAWTNNWTATNITWSNSNVGYQSKFALWWANSSLTYSSITYTTSVIWKDGGMLINSSEVTATALNWVSGSSYSILRFYDRVLSDDEIQTLYLEWQQKLTPARNTYPKLFDWLVWYWDFKNGDLSNLVDWVLATNNGATLTTDYLGYKNNAYDFGVPADKKTIITNFPNLDNFTIFTFSKRHNTTDTSFLLEKWDNTNWLNFYLWNRWTWNDWCPLNPWDVIQWFRDWWWNYKDVTYNITPDTSWHSYWYTFNWTTIKWFYDWILKVSNNPWSTPAYWWNILHIWCSSADVSCRYWNKNLSLVLIFNRALSDSEIKLLHNLLMQ